MFKLQTTELFSITIFLDGLIHKTHKVVQVLLKNSYKCLRMMLFRHSLMSNWVYLQIVNAFLSMLKGDKDTFLKCQNWVYLQIFSIQLEKFSSFKTEQQSAVIKIFISCGSQN